MGESLEQQKPRLGGKGRGARRGSRCETVLRAACLHFSVNGSVFLTSACFCSLCRCWRVGEEHHCEADEVSDYSLFCFSSRHLWQIHNDLTAQAPLLEIFKYRLFFNIYLTISIYCINMNLKNYTYCTNAHSNRRKSTAQMSPQTKISWV